MKRYLYQLFIAIFLSTLCAISANAQILPWATRGDDVEVQQLDIGDDANVGPGNADYMKGETICRTSVMNEITAAFNTQGYWLLDFIVDSFANGLGGWGALLYACIVFGGIIMMAMGQPPRMYLWFLLGPLIYNWALFTNVTESTPKRNVKGVCWYIGGKKLSQERVWRLAEAGMVNSPAYKKGWMGGYTVKGADGNGGPNKGVTHLPALFLFIDEVISEPIAWIVEVSGIKSQLQNKSTGNTEVLVSPPPFKAETILHTVKNSPSWYVLGNTRWQELVDITDASLEGNDDLREALIGFMSGECGTVIRENIHKNKYLTAGARKAGGALPEHVFKDINKLGKNLDGAIVPIPTVLRDIMKKADREYTLGNFLRSQAFISGLVANQTRLRNFTCAQYLYTIIQGFRWASALQYNMLVKRGTDMGIPATWVTYNLLYGWKFDPKNPPTQMSAEEQANFVINMILAYMLRNELSTAKKPVNQQYLTSTRLKKYVDQNARTIGSTSKYGEFYQWAKLVPYMQGMCLYLLAAGYPLACLLMLIPGWHKALLTWICFYAWAKSWDAGFAIIGALDKNIWGMLGNNADAALINSRIYSMKDYGALMTRDGDVSKTLPAGIKKGSCELANDYAMIGCIRPEVIDNPSTAGSSDAGQSYDSVYKIFEQGLILASNLQHDIANSYYIYLMSALYFAVPAVTGQIFLAARAGIASLATESLTSAAGDAGKAVGSAFTSEWQNRMIHAQSVAAQEAYARMMREEQSHARTALDAQNKEMMQRIGSMNEGLTQDQVGSTSGRHQAVQESFAAATKGFIESLNKLTGNKWTGDGDGDLSDEGGGPSSGGGGGSGGTHGKVEPHKIGKAAYAKDAGTLGSIYLSTTLAAADVVYENMYGRMDAIAAQYADRSQTLSAQSQYQSGLAGRYGDAAKQQMEEAMWREKRTLGNQMVGIGSAMGVFAGEFKPGPKPTNLNGMIGLGYLDKGRVGEDGKHKVDDNGYSFLNYGYTREQVDSGKVGTIDSGKWGNVAAGYVTNPDGTPVYHEKMGSFETRYGLKVKESNIIDAPSKYELKEGANTDHYWASAWNAQQAALTMSTNQNGAVVERDSEFMQELKAHVGEDIVNDPYKVIQNLVKEEDSPPPPSSTPQPSSVESINSGSSSSNNNFSQVQESHSQSFAQNQSHDDLLKDAADYKELQDEHDRRRKAEAKRQSEAMFANNNTKKKKGSWFGIGNKDDDDELV